MTALALTTEHFAVERFTHAVQTLKFIVAALTRQFDDRGNGVGIVRGELRVQRIAGREQAPGAGEIGHIGIDLARIDRVVGQPRNLGELDLGIPVRALDQTHRNAPPHISGQCRQPVDHRRCALLVGL